MSDLTLLKIAQMNPSMVPLHLIARAYLLGNARVRAAMIDRALQAEGRTEMQRQAIRSVLLISKRASLEALDAAGAFDMQTRH